MIKSITKESVKEYLDGWIEHWLDEINKLEIERDKRYSDSLKSKGHYISVSGGYEYYNDIRHHYRTSIKYYQRVRKDLLGENFKE